MKSSDFIRCAVGGMRYAEGFARLDGREMKLKWIEKNGDNRRWLGDLKS